MRTWIVLFLVLLLVASFSNLNSIAGPRTFGQLGSNSVYASGATFGQESVLNGPGFKQCEDGITVYTSSGKAQRIPLPSSATYSTCFSTETSVTIFVNDARGGDKIDRLLKNLTMLVEDGYIEGGRVQVLVLMGEEIWPNAYELGQLDSRMLSLFESCARRLNATVRSAQNKLPLVAVDLPYNYLSNLTQQEDVSHIFLNRKFYARLDESVPIIKPPDKMEQLEQKFGTEINGTNVKIAITDTGIDKNHPDLEGKVILEASFTSESPMDGNGHGTHVASIAAGTGKASNYQYVGVAPGALLINAKVLTNGGWGYEEWIIAGVTWAVENSADIISMSLGADVNGDGTDPMSLTLDWATAQGVVCAVAAGNAGQTGMFSVGTPAVARNVITVGATTKGDDIAYFSSQGLTSDYRLKPDVVAPGVDIIAARAKFTSMEKPINEYYTKASGTSMATPHVAGAAALILQVYPDWTPKMVKAALMENAKILDGEHLWRQGAGRIDVVAAINSTFLIVDPSASLGAIRQNPINATFTVMNLGSEEAYVTVSATGRCNGTVVNNVYINMTRLNISANSNRTILLSLNVTEADLGGWEEGWLNVSGAHHSAMVPFIALLSNYIDVSLYDEDGQTLLASDFILVTYPERKLVQFLGYDDYLRPTSFRLLKKPGNYSIIASMSVVKKLLIDPHLLAEDNTRSFMIEKVIQVPKVGGLLVNMSLAEARKCTIFTNDTKGNNLIIHSYKQAISGDPYYDEASGTTKMRWTHVNYWMGQHDTPQYVTDLKGPITFYTSDSDHREKLRETFGFYGSTDIILSEVYLLAWQYSNTSIPSVMRPSFTGLAKYNLYYGMPETYPSSLAITSYIHFADEVSPSYLQGWIYGMDRVHAVPAGLNATYYLTPKIASYNGRYWMFYLGWSPPLVNYPQQLWSIPVLAEGECGYLRLGSFKVGPYVPGLVVQTTLSANNSTISLTGDIWKNLTWPYEHFGLDGSPPYPFWGNTYHLYIDEVEVASGALVRLGSQGWGEVFWDNLSFKWNVKGLRARLLLEMHGLLTISQTSTYQIEFELAKNSKILPLLRGLSMPLNYSAGETLTLNPEFQGKLASLSVQYSFDSGRTWQNSTQSLEGFTVPRAFSRQVAIRVNATDMNGNRYSYFTNPAAMCRDVKLHLLKYNKTDILIRFTDTEDKNLGVTLIQVRTGDTISCYVTDDKGLIKINKPPLTQSMVITFPSIGLYGPNVFPLQFRLRGDVNGDGIVSINDVVLISSAYGSRPGDSNWRPEADIAPPWDRIDILDLVTCVSDYGKTW